jgi:hypothetical protein
MEGEGEYDWQIDHIKEAENTRGVDDIHKYQKRKLVFGEFLALSKNIYTLKFMNHYEVMYCIHC